MSKRKKQAYGCLIAGISGLLVLDWVIDPGGGPRGADAAQRLPERAQPPTSGAGAGDAAGRGAAAVVVAAARFPTGLPGNGTAQRDLFGLGDAVRRVMLSQPSGMAAGEPATAPGVEQRPLISAAEAFSARHVVSAVVSGPALEAARVDEAWITVGQRIDECTLVRIRGCAAVFECFGEAIELSVAPPELSGGTGPGADSELKRGRSRTDTHLD